MQLLNLARELEAMAQTGLHYCADQYDRVRYLRLREIAAEILAAHSTLAATEILDWSSAEFGYATPKVDVRAFVMREDEVLLIREDADEGRWTLPGGWADVNETPSESVVREVREECGYVVRPIRLLAVLDREKQRHEPSFPYHVYKLFFHCEIIGGGAVASAESSEARFFSVNKLPELSRSRVLEAQIRRFAVLVREGMATTDFD